MTTHLVDHRVLDENPLVPSYAIALLADEQGVILVGQEANVIMVESRRFFHGVVLAVHLPTITNKNEQKQTARK